MSARTVLHSATPPLLVFLLVTLACSCSRNGEIRASGTIEMDEVDVSSLAGGRVLEIRVNEGDSVRVGDTLAVLDHGELVADLQAQAARAQSAAAQYHDLQAGARPEEVLAARADLAAARADAELADSNLVRMQKLAASRVVSQQDLDRARAQRDAAAAKARAAAENLRMRETGFRTQQITAARDAATAAQAQLAGAKSRAQELVLTAPISGVVLLKSFQPGEVAQPGAPLVTLGNPDSLWMRVYVAAPKLTDVRLGSPVEVRPIGAKRAYPGRVVEIASRAEFTPRAALTEEEQANLVFGVKVQLAPSGGALKAGLPADARIHGHVE
ncbi:MAG TPA: HlyD family efflux transporter periplasmic adaptor subunit [Candidatus Sulfotelmatobacter sp.]|nr:HlyD family efflux transporter periplasmic adaptor subunit [Candidatus Sulfotelmatobacter sp.]